MYSVETLARVDMLCLDKTGTITQRKDAGGGRSSFDRRGEVGYASILASYMAHSEDKNPTAQAIRQRFVGGYLSYDFKLPFSSDLEVGAMELEVGNSFLRGAWDVAGLWSPRSQRLERGSRVLVLALSQENETITSHQKPSDIQALALLEILDPHSRRGSWDAGLSSFSEVGLKIISGDNPSHGIQHCQKGWRLDYHSYGGVQNHGWEWVLWLRRQLFSDVFLLIKRSSSSKPWKAGHTWHMTGIGCILALREAGCSIVMAEGWSTTRQIANLVLLISGFKEYSWDSLWKVVAWSNNIAHISDFLDKDHLLILIAVICVASALLGRSGLDLGVPLQRSRLLWLTSSCKVSHHSFWLWAKYPNLLSQKTSSEVHASCPTKCSHGCVQRPFGKYLERAKVGLR